MRFTLGGQKLRRRHVHTIQMPFDLNPDVKHVSVFAFAAPTRFNFNQKQGKVRHKMTGHATGMSPEGWTQSCCPPELGLPTLYLQ